MEKMTPQSSYTDFLKQLEEKEKVEEKLRFCLEFMRALLSSSSTPVFRDFWEAKRLCLDLFKEKLAPRSRAVFWTEYVELSDEIRKLKELLDEQSSFAQEQIELAVNALEGDLQKIPAFVAEMEDLPLPEVFLPKKGIYNSIQKKLNLLNTFSGRINALRKELIHTQMRIRHKNRLFEKLSKLGDLIFPPKKELVEQISSQFLKDVDQFIQGEVALGGYVKSKEEIKGLQQFAKLLTLNTNSFTQARERLSGMWDQLKEKEKQQQEKRSEQRQVFKQNAEILRPKIDALEVVCREEKISLKEAEEKIEAIAQEMREMELGKEEVKALKQRLYGSKRSLEEKEQEEAEKRKLAENLEQKKKLQALGALLDHSQELVDQAEAHSNDTLVEKWEALVKEEKRLSPLGINKALLENRIDTIADHIEEKKWQLAIEQDAEDLTSTLHTLLDGRHKARRKLKDSLEEHRKIVGGSGLDLEHAMLYQQLISDQKMRLDAIETMIEEIEERLFDLEE